MWAEWGRLTLRMDFTGPIFWARVRTPAARRDEAALTAALARYDRDLALLETQIGAGPWLLGEDFTLADILAGLQLYRYFTIDIPRTDRPGIAAYYARLAPGPPSPSTSWSPTTSWPRTRTPDAASRPDPEESPMITIHGRATSLNVQAVMWTIAELGLDVRAPRRRPELRRQRHAGIPGDEP